MEYGSNNTQGFDHNNMVGQAIDDSEIHQSRRSTYRDWFSSNKFAAAEDSFDLMEEASPPAANNEIYYEHDEHVRHVSDHHQGKQQHYYTQQQTLGLGIGGQSACNIIEREHMFDKVVTPSDVGKLNRLVIPKQHAEKYFPLDSSSNEKGLLLNFEDLTGKSWSFRYSYWNSSQSYVMTKGWSRFVKEKKLDAGDIVSFQRVVGEGENHRLFIDWRRRPIPTLPPFSPSPFHHTQFYRSAGGIHPSWSPLLLRPPPPTRDITFHIPNSTPSSHYYYNGYNNGGNNYMGQVGVTNDASMVYLTTSPPEMIEVVRGRPGAAVERIPMVFESVPVVKGKKVVAAAAKRLRLFGVNMECPVSSDTSSSDEYEKLSSSSSAIPGNNLNHSSAALLFPPSSTRMCNGTPVSNKGKMTISFNLDI